jgi:hypothetical protein
MTNYKCPGSDRGLIEALPGIWLEGLRKSTNISIRKADVPAEIRT